MERQRGVHVEPPPGVCQHCEVMEVACYVGMEGGEFLRGGDGDAGGGRAGYVQEVGVEHGDGGGGGRHGDTYDGSSGAWKEGKRMWERRL